LPFPNPRRMTFLFYSLSRFFFFFSDRRFPFYLSFRPYGCTFCFFSVPPPSRGFSPCFFVFSSPPRSFFMAFIFPTSPNGGFMGSLHSPGRKPGFLGFFFPLFFVGPVLYRSVVFYRTVFLSFYVPCTITVFSSPLFLLAFFFPLYKLPLFFLPGGGCISASPPPPPVTLSFLSFAFFSSLTLTKSWFSNVDQPVLLFPPR